MKRLCFIFLLMLPLATQAQNDYVSDEGGKTTGGLWTEVGVTKVLPYDLSLGLDAGFRTNEWFNEADRFDIGLNLGWKLGKHWKFGVGYTFFIKHYPSESAYKSTTETEYKYRATGAIENTDFTEFVGAPTYSDGSTSYAYKGKNIEVKDYTRFTQSYWRPKHRISIDGAYSYKLWKLLRLTLRERYQLTYMPDKEVTRTRTGIKTTTKYRDPSYTGGAVTDESTITYDEIVGPTSEDAGEESSKEKSSKTTHVLRSRLTFEIDKKGWDWTPFLYVESFNNMSESWHFDKFRTSVGVDYSISKQHKVSLGYVFNHENDDDGDLNIHAISFGYKYKF